MGRTVANFTFLLYEHEFKYFYEGIDIFSMDNCYFLNLSTKLHSLYPPDLEISETAVENSRFIDIKVTIHHFRKIGGCLDGQ